MRVLAISGDKTFGPGHPRYELQCRMVDRLEVLYIGPGTLFPKIPKGPFDVITAQDPFWRGHLAWHLTWFFHARLNIQVHTDLSGYSPLKRWWAGYNLRKAHSIRVVSEKIRGQIAKMHVKAPIHVLPIYIDLERFKSIVHKPQKKKMILWIGRFEEEKNPEEAFPIFNKVREAGIDASLVLLGKGRLRMRLKSAHNLPYRDDIEFPGWADPYPYFEMADVVLCTSLHESWGASIIESLAAGIPVVAPDVGIAKEAGAIVVDRSKLAEAVIDVLNHPRRGELKFSLPTDEEWAKRWRETLL